MQQTSVKCVQDSTWSIGRDDPMRIVQNIEIQPYYYML